MNFQGCCPRCLRVARVTSLDHGGVAGNTPAFFGVLGGFGDAMLCLTAISLSLNCSSVHSFVALFTYRLENVLILE